MALNFQKVNKAEVLSHLAKQIVQKIEVANVREQIEGQVYSESNLEFLLQAQQKMTSKLRELLKFLKANENRHYQKVKDGALVGLSGYKEAEWVFVFGLSTLLDYQGIPICIDDGSLGRARGSIIGAKTGDRIKLEGNERNITDIEVEVLGVF